MSDGTFGICLAFGRETHLEHRVDLGLLQSQVGRGDEQSFHGGWIVHAHGVAPPDQRALPSRGFLLRLEQRFLLFLLLFHLFNLLLGLGSRGALLRGGTGRIAYRRRCRRGKLRYLYLELLGVRAHDARQVIARLLSERVDEYALLGLHHRSFQSERLRSLLGIRADDARLALVLGHGDGDL